MTESKGTAIAGETAFQLVRKPPINLGWNTALVEGMINKTHVTLMN